MSASRFHHFVETAFAEIFGSSAQPVSGGWNLPLADSIISARVEESWLVMTSPVAASADPLELLARNGALRGGVKFGRNGHTEIRAEIPLEDDAPIGAAIHEAWKGFASARDEKVEGANAAAATSEALAAACAETGWPFTTRADGSLAVELETRGAFVQCSLDDARASVALANFPATQTEAASAVSAFLLEAAGVVRMARPVVEVREGEMKPRFEVIFAAPPDAAQIAHALAALSVAWRLCGEEVKALQKTDVAREYLALRRVATAASGQSTTPEKGTT